MRIYLKHFKDRCIQPKNGKYVEIHPNDGAYGSVMFGKLSGVKLTSIECIIDRMCNDFIFLSHRRNQHLTQKELRNKKWLQENIYMIAGFSGHGEFGITLDKVEEDYFDNLVEDD